jgi:hypothetical protein
MYLLIGVIATATVTVSVVVYKWSSTSAPTSVVEQSLSENKDAKYTSSQSSTESSNQASAQPLKKEDAQNLRSNELSANQVNDQTAVNQQITAAPVAPSQGCFKFQYDHRDAGHKDMATCSAHRNTFKPLLSDRFSIEDLKVKNNNICVRVDGVPVKFQRVKDIIQIGALPGPESKVSVAYCIGKAKCSESCVIPRDQFMEALSGSDDEGRAFAAAKWDDKDNTDKDVTAGLSAELTGDGQDDKAVPFFKHWKLIDQKESCSS